MAASRQDALSAVMFICLFNSARAGEVTQLSPVAASHLHFLSTEGVAVV